MLRIGLDTSIGEEFLGEFSSTLELVRIPDEPEGEIDIDFWCPSIYAETAKRQWPHLRGVQVVQSLYAGVDGLLRWLPRTVTLCDARGVHDIPIAEWIVGAILAMQKYFPFYLNLQHGEDWDGREGAEKIYLLSKPGVKGYAPPVLIDELAEATVLIIGYGSIGAAVEARLQPFGVKILRVARTAREGVATVAELDGLLPQADIVVMMLPGTSETRGLLNAERIALMKPGALLVNAGRGATVDTDALVNALNSHRIRAALDVVDPEPLPAGHPLWRAPNLLLTPHVAGDTERFIRRALRLANEQAERFALGKPLHNIVSGEY
jgi:phosphoglycerate dehydrogenase-like enzyme